MHTCAPAKLASQQELKMEMDATSVKEALVWLEKLTGEPVSGPIAVLARGQSDRVAGMDFWEALRNGVVLCKAVNALRPDRPMIEKIFTRNVALLERGNIEEYLKACTKLGMGQADLFHVSDLYERKYLPGVLQNILALGRLAETRNMLPDSAPKMRRHRRAASSGRVLWADQEPPNPSLSAQAALAQQQDAAPAQTAARAAPALAPAASAVPAASYTLPVVTVTDDETALKELMTEAGAIAGLSAYELDTDLAQLKALGVTSVTSLRKFMRNRDIWLAAKLPLLTKVAIERALLKRYPPRGFLFKFFFASLTGGAAVLAVYKFWPRLEPRLIALLPAGIHIPNLKQYAHNLYLAMPRLPRIKLVVEHPS